MRSLIKFGFNFCLYENKIRLNNNNNSLLINKYNISQNSHLYKIKLKYNYSTIQKIQKDIINYQQNDNLSNIDSIEKLLSHQLVRMQLMHERPVFFRQFLHKFRQLLINDPKNRPAMQIYLKNRQQIDKIIYSIKKSNIQCILKPRQIIQVFYILKILIDCGYQNKITGFQYRTMMNLVKLIEKDNKSKISQGNIDKDKSLTIDQMITGYWLSSSIKCNQHQYKQESFRKILVHISIWRKQRILNNDNPSISKSLPFSLEQVACIFQAFYMDSSHLLSDYSTLEFLIQFLNEFREDFIEKNSFNEKFNVIKEIYYSLIGIQQQMISGKTYIDLRQLILYLTKNFHQIIKQQVNLTDKVQIQKRLKQNFILFQQIFQNKFWLMNLSYDNTKKLLNILEEKLDEDYNQLKDQNIKMELLSLKIRCQIYKLYLIQSQPLKNIKQANQRNKKCESILLQYKNCINNISQSLLLSIGGIQKQMIKIYGKKLTKSDKKRQQIYLKSQQKQKIQLKKKNQSIIQSQFKWPIIDYLSHSNVNDQSFLKQLKGQLQSKFIEYQHKLSQKDVQQIDKNKQSIIPVWNKYFWTLKFIRLNERQVSIQSLQNKVQNILNSISQFIQSQNRKRKNKINPQQTIYFMYAYFCKIQQQLFRQNGKFQSIQDKFQLFKSYKSYLYMIIFNQTNSFEDKVFKQFLKKIPSRFHIHLLIQDPISEDNFDMANFFNKVYKQTRFYEHFLLSTQITIKLFSNKKLFEKNINKLIANTNQRDYNNLIQIMYLILLSNQKYFNYSVSQQRQHSDKLYRLSEIRIKILQNIVQKCKGSKITQILRIIITPIKTSYLKRHPLKYELNQFSLFQITKNNDKQLIPIVKNIFEILSGIKNFNLGLLQIILLNIPYWGKRSNQIVIENLIPWMNKLIQNKNLHFSFLQYFVMVISRLLRFNVIYINSENHKKIHGFFVNNVPKLFENLSCLKKQNHYSFIGCVIFDLEYLVKMNKIQSNLILNILYDCKQQTNMNQRKSHQAFQSKYYKKLIQILDKSIHDIEYLSNSNKQTIINDFSPNVQKSGENNIIDKYQEKINTKIWTKSKSSKEINKSSLFEKSQKQTSQVKPMKQQKLFKRKQ